MQYEIIPGRILAVEMLKDGILTIVINVHIHCNPICQIGKIRMLRKLKEYIGRHLDRFIFIIGDFNFVGDAWDRVDLQTGKDCGKSCSVNQFWDDHFADFTELYQPDCTRFPSSEHGRVVGSASRLDRIFSTFLLKLLQFWRSGLPRWASNRSMTSVTIFLFVQR